MGALRTRAFSREICVRVETSRLRFGQMHQTSGCEKLLPELRLYVSERDESIIRRLVGSVAGEMSQRYVWPRPDAVGFGTSRRGRRPAPTAPRNKGDISHIRRNVLADPRARE